jgi:IS30 family transposase
VAKQVPARNGGTLTRPDKGETMNPNGRPKGARSLSTILKEMLSEEIEIIVDGVKTKKEFQDVIIRRLLKSANDGNLQAIKEIFDRIEGKPRESVTIDAGVELIVSRKIVK